MQIRKKGGGERWEGLWLPQGSASPQPPGSFQCESRAPAVPEAGVSECQASSKRRQIHALRKGLGGHLVNVSATHHTSRKRELLDLEWNGSDHIRRRSPFK